MTTGTNASSTPMYMYRNSEEVLFPISFISYAKGFANVYGSPNFWSAGVTNITKSKITIMSCGDTAETNVNVDWIAVGK